MDVSLTPRPWSPSSAQINGQTRTNALETSSHSFVNKPQTLIRTRIGAIPVVEGHITGGRQVLPIVSTGPNIEHNIPTSGALGGVQRNPTKRLSSVVVPMPCNLFEGMPTRPGSPSDLVWISFVSSFASIDLACLRPDPMTYVPCLLEWRRHHGGHDQWWGGTETQCVTQVGTQTTQRISKKSHCLRMSFLAKPKEGPKELEDTRNLRTCVFARLR
jgi:hypothetical protein